MNNLLFLCGVMSAVGCYWAGRRAGYLAANRKYLLLQEKEDAKMDEILRRYAQLGRTELLEQLRDKPSK